MDLGLKDKVALVSGSYRGTGSGIAETLAREGAAVLVHGFEAGQADPLVARLRRGVEQIGDANAETQKDDHSECHYGASCHYGCSVRIVY